MELLKKFAKKYKSFLVKCAILLITIFAAFGIIKIADYYLEKFKLSYYPFEIMRHEAQLSYNEYKSELVKEVKTYIDSVAPLTHTHLSKPAKSMTWILNLCWRKVRLKVISGLRVWP